MRTPDCTAISKNAKAKIRGLVDANIIGICVSDRDGRLIEANDVYLRTLGHDREDLVSGRIHWMELTPPEWRDRADQALSEFARTGAIQPFEKEYFRKDGSRVPVLIGVAGIDESENQRVAFVLDLTERKRAEQALREREAKIRGLFEANIIGIFTANRGGGIIEANDAFLQIVGYDREDLISGRLRWTGLRAPEQPDRDALIVEELTTAGAIQPFETLFLRKDGSRVPVLVGAATFEPGGDEGVAFVLDLTERKRAEDAARRSEKELRDVIETIPAFAFSIRMDGSTEFVNRRVLEYTGWSPAELVSGQKWQSTIHPDDLENHLNKWRASLASGEPFENEVRHRNARGEYRWFLVRAVPLRDEHGNSQVVRNPDGHRGSQARRASLNAE